MIDELWVPGLCRSQSPAFFYSHTWIWYHFPYVHSRTIHRLFRLPFMRLFWLLFMRLFWLPFVCLFWLPLMRLFWLPFMHLFWLPYMRLFQCCQTKIPKILTFSKKKQHKSAHFQYGYQMQGIFKQNAKMKFIFTIGDSLFHFYS